MFEIVYTCTDYYDGPRRGIADFLGRPHLFESEWGDDEKLDADTFLLSPVDGETLALALEDWAIWRRWETAFHVGRATLDTHPALPEERARHDELQRLLEGRLVVEPSCAVRKTAEFRAREDPCWSGYGFRPLEVRWLDPPKVDDLIDELLESNPSFRALVARSKTSPRKSFPFDPEA